MSGAFSIALPQLVLWYDSTRIQTWPALAARVPPSTVLSSPTDFGRMHVTERMTDTRHSAAEKITRNLPGLERKGQRLVLRGVGLIERLDRGYGLSRAGRDLGETYRKDPDGREWIQMLATLLLKREPRTRLLVALLSEEGAELSFTKDEWWGGSVQRATITNAAGVQVAPFAKKDTPTPNLRSAMKDRAWWALGEWREDPALDGAIDCEFVGQLKGPFSLHDIGLALRSSCEVFLHLGVLCHRGTTCWLDHTRATNLFGAELAADFGWHATVVDEKPLLQEISELVALLRSDTGFIVADELRTRLRRRGIDNPDREIARLEAEGRLIIEAADYGQARHGHGLYDDPGKQLIKLRVCGGDRL